MSKDQIDYKSANVEKYGPAQRARFSKSAEKIYGLERFARDVPELVKEGEVLLDIGGGAGVYADIIREMEITDRIHAVDISADALAERNPKDVCATGDMEALPYGDASFDRVLFLASLHHVQNTAKAIGEAWRVLKPGGHAVLYEPVSLRRLLRGDGTVRSVSDPSEFSFSMLHVLGNLTLKGFGIERIRYHGFIQRFIPKRRVSVLRSVDSVERVLSSIPLLKHGFGLLADYATIVARKDHAS